MAAPWFDHARGSSARRLRINAAAGPPGGIQALTRRSRIVGRASEWARIGFRSAPSGGASAPSRDGLGGAPTGPLMPSRRSTPGVPHGAQAARTEAGVPTPLSPARCKRRTGLAAANAASRSIIRSTGDTPGRRVARRRSRNANAAR